MTPRSPARRSTIRWRLTVLYGSAFFIAGAVLICLMYVFLQQSLHNRPAGAQGVVSQFLDDRGVRNRPVVEGLLRAVATESERERQDTLRAMLTWSFVSLGVVGVVAGGFGWLMAGRALAPLQDVTATARRVADRNLHERIALDGPDDEIKELADTFDAMLDRLDRAFESQRRFVANASHELRTPLAINRTLIEVALEDPEVAESTRTLGRTLLDVNLRNERLIDGLLVLASSDQQLRHRSRVDLGEVTGRALTTVAGFARAAGIRIDSDLPQAHVHGDAALLERLAQNLIDNALRYNVPEDGWVSVTVGTQDGFATLRVENSGPVVAAAEIPGLFEPFRRLAAADRVAESPAPGRGAGLGLSIVRSVAVAHGGDVRAEARPAGGLDVAVTLTACQ
ncbi:MULTISPECIES: sensor histidine kinase [Mycolicibacterium]|jgi:signal transduction histidine kinase|uniref:histidine kinase n=2 Tax=Mycolicibacterium TaxID=1866885 RepID=A1TBS1_MYCVP|nr:MULTISPECIES: ATP-binding protein [Mycolicibacterium]ABM14621.1 integral membrane sensor signal transduction histidine kinase [Mycolicibacterium vanbaalenii PYR-1]MDN4520564.1 ATP-binding protein [Mycolicibacterium austroafricanum]QRZ04751.1 HAMP domain-containing protein [Mycolicibacterium austroafricanum]QZT66578.1 HAMP domain-containing protein [Mycolicibacterium austroafricanum]QZY44455.1 HAMP domain-containing protein [Mycolicibacterium austroafricanum]